MRLVKSLSSFGWNLSRKGFSTKSDRLINVTRSESNDLAVVSLLKPPVNTLDYGMLSVLHSALSSLQDEKCRGIILTSECPTVFCAGLDLNEVYKAERGKLRRFWTMLQDAWFKLYTYPYATVAAITGHSPAGGCLLALACDYRVMVRQKFTIGLNETKVGMVTPFWLQETMRNVIGTRQAELALLSGKLFTADQALEIGLVDAVAKDRFEALSLAEDFIAQQNSLIFPTRRLVKGLFRQDTVNKFMERREEDIEFNLDFLTRPEIQQTIEKYINSMRKS